MTRRAPSRTVTLLVLLLVLGLCVLAATPFGGSGVVGALFGGGTGLVLVLSGVWLLEPIVRRSAAAALPAALGLYTVKAVAALVLLAAVTEVGVFADAMDPRFIAVGLAAVAVTWTCLQVWTFLHNRVPTYDLGDGS